MGKLQPGDRARTIAHKNLEPVATELREITDALTETASADELSDCLLKLTGVRSDGLRVMNAWHTATEAKC